MTGRSVPPGPFTVGSYGTLTVTYGGMVEALEQGTVTIGGHVVPRHLGGAVRTVSLGTLDEAAKTRCDRDHCDDGDCDPDPHDYQADRANDFREAVDDLARTVTARHTDHHDGALRFCPDPVCRALYDLEGEL